jgi:hypothetical protein
MRQKSDKVGVIQRHVRRKYLGIGNDVNLNYFKNNLIPENIQPVI